MSKTNQLAVGFIIKNPLTDSPMEETPDGISLKNKVFQTKDELKEFVDKHWENVVFCAEGKE